MIDDYVKLVSVLVLSYIVGIEVELELKLKLVKVEHSCCNVGCVTSM